MRLTLDLNSFAHFDKTAFASLWLDTTTLRWSRESHAVLDIPEWGAVISAKGETRLYDQSVSAPRLIACLEKLDLGKIANSPDRHDCNEPPGPHDQSRGHVLLYRQDDDAHASEGRWRLLFIDRETTSAEHSNFADDAG